MVINTIKQFVDKLGITRYQFYKRTGISKTTAYALYEDFKRIPDAETIDRICNTFNCKPGDLLDYVREK
ncbi:helix-turn-helix domain-containing protein [Tolypothrix bouteillei VB521301_2]|uniref:HTH cro/C1-type domain-containing protein n=1 Tax=Tolypothrix bouteillei VB521301 TaxID=1479485 RepID=A0A0C1NFX1_9CYAN